MNFLMKIQFNKCYSCFKLCENINENESEEIKEKCNKCRKDCLELLKSLDKGKLENIEKSLKQKNKNENNFFKFHNL